MYSLKYSEKAIKQLSKLNKSTQKLILTWIAKNLENCENPRIKGKGLTANRSGEWRYRVADYRIICDIQDNELVILALSIGHRKTIY
jgi:addiction module toxin, relE/stbE family